MGHIVGFEFDCSADSVLREILKSAPYFSDHDLELDRYNYRGESNRQSGDSMPDAYATPDTKGIEFCGYLDNLVIKEVYDYLLNELRNRFGTVKEVL